jgi:hypothetical protein
MYPRYNNNMIIKNTIKQKKRKKERKQLAWGLSLLNTLTVGITSKTIAFTLLPFTK